MLEYRLRLGRKNEQVPFISTRLALYLQYLIPKGVPQDIKVSDGARSRVAAQVNSELTLMYWHIGERINREVLGNERAEYGKQIVATVTRQLQMEYGTKGFDEKSIRRMMRFAVTPFSLTNQTCISCEQE